MNTTELFAEQVLAGLLVMLTGGLVFYPQLLQAYHAHVDAKDYLEQVVAGGFILGAAYLAGMVYDRVADTLLQDLESHCRLRFAFDKFDPDCLRDPLEEGKNKMLVLGNEQATNYMEYLRSRIRLTRALTVAIPALTMALLLAMDWGRASRWWGSLALTIPIVYLAVLMTKLIRRRELFERPPKTYKVDELHAYYLKRARLLPKNCDGKTPPPWVILRDEVWIGLAFLIVSASLLIVSTHSWIRFWIPAAGISLTLLVGWAWWRILITFYAFLRNYNEYKMVEDWMSTIRIGVSTKDGSLE